MFITCYLIFTLVLWGVLSLYLGINSNKIAMLQTQEASILEPAVAILIAVRNEEKHLAEALKSVCSLAYSNYRVVVVNDRSTDATAQILSNIAVQYPHINIVTVTELPPSWLGKNNALYQGFLQCDEEWLLFTDADVVFDRMVLKKAIGVVMEQQADHLTIFPEVTSASKMLNSVLQTFALMLEIKLRPWEVSDPASKASIGIGAFNLIKRDVYQSIGTHKAIKMRPDDDLKLGQRVKEAGFKQEVRYGEGQISLAWYASVAEFIKGLMKNTFSTFDYEVAPAIGAALATLIIFALPIPLGLVFGDGIAYGLILAVLAVQGLLFGSRPGKRRWWDFLMISFAGFLMVYIILKSTMLTLKNKGINWRDSFYSLQELKANK